MLCKLYTTSTETTDLLVLIDGPNNVVLSEVERVLAAAHHYDALCRLYRARGEDSKLLDVWSRCGSAPSSSIYAHALTQGNPSRRLATGEIVGEDVPDPLSSMFTYLQEKRDRALAQCWGVWLIKWDSGRALRVSLHNGGDSRNSRDVLIIFCLTQLLTTVGANKRSTKVPAVLSDDAALLEQIQATDPAAGAQFLEYLVFQRRSQVRTVSIRPIARFFSPFRSSHGGRPSSSLFVVRRIAHSASVGLHGAGGRLPGGRGDDEALARQGR